MLLRRLYTQDYAAFVVSCPRLRPPRPSAGGPFIVVATMVLQRFQSLGSKSRIEAVASPFCRRNHSSMQRRRLESDAEDRCNHGRCRRNPSSLPQQKLESAQISAKFLNAFRANHSKIHKYLQYSQNLTGGRNELENQSEILILLQFIGKHL